MSGFKNRKEQSQQLYRNRLNKQKSFQKKECKWPEITRKDVQTCLWKRKENLNYNEILVLTHQSGKRKRSPAVQCSAWQICVGTGDLVQCLWECTRSDDFGGDFNKITLEVLSIKITYTYSVLDSAIPLWEPLLKRHITVIANFPKYHLCPSLLEIFIVLKLDLHIEWPNKKSKYTIISGISF